MDRVGASPDEHVEEAREEPIGREELLAEIETAALRQKRRLLLLVRSGLTAAIGYLILFSPVSPETRAGLVAFVLLYLASNLIVLALPMRVLARAAFDISIVLADTAAISFGLYLIPQTDADVFVFYFAIILLTSLSGRLGGGLVFTLLAAVALSIGYFGFIWFRSSAAAVLQPEILLRLPFFLLAGAFYAFFVDSARRGHAAVAAATEREVAKTEFLALLTHDLKQPLWVAQQSAALLSDKLSADAVEERELISQVMVNLRRMEALALNFLDFERIESRGIRVNPQPASLNAIITGLFEAYRPAIQLKGIAVELSLDPTLPAGWIDPPQIERALANLLDNAVKYTGKDGKILCRTASEGKLLRVVIGDTGSGFTKEQAAAVFSRFQRGIHIIGRPSTGLGLYISHAIITAHGGTIQLDQSKPVGTWFAIQLPAVPPAA